MVMDLQYFGGRGGASSLLNEKPVSKLMAKVYFNSAKKSDALRSDHKVQADSRLEKIIRNEDTDYIKSIDTKNEAVKVSSYIIDRLNDNNRRIAKLGSEEAVFKNQKLAIEHRKLVAMNSAMQDKMHEFSKKVEAASNVKARHAQMETTTYQRARNRRIKNFDAWFNGGKR